MDHRFATLLTEAFLRLPPKTKLTSSQSAPTITQFANESHASRLKRFVKAILPTSPSSSKPQKPKLTANELGEHLWGTVIVRSAKAPKAPKKKAQTLKKDDKKKSQGVVVVLSPAPVSLPSFKRRDIFGKGPRSGESGRDSKFSSISSFASLQPAASLYGASTSSIKLSIHEYERLRSLTRRVKRGLMKQEYLTGHLSRNLVQLLSRKEKQITQFHYIRRIRREDREAMQRTIFLGREHACRIFLRKAVFLQRSRGDLDQLSGMFESNVLPVGDGLVELRVSPETIHDFFVTIQADLGLQQKLDQDLLRMVKKSCSERRFLATVNDKILTERFVHFVGERISVLGACYESTGLSVKKIDVLQDRLGVLGMIS